MKDELCPTFDKAYPALIRDLETRGLFDETLVVCANVLVFNSLTL